MPSVYLDQSALVTGASSGIGAELARRLAGAGANLVLVARREDRLRALAAELTDRATGARGSADPSRRRVEIVAADLIEPGAPKRIFDAAVTRLGRIDILINNAGVGEYGRFVEENPASTDRMIALNVTALTQLTRLALPGMADRRHGWVLNVSTLAACQPMPFMSSYSASKAYVLQFTHSLREEVRRHNVCVTCLLPGLTRTEFFDQSNYGRLRIGIDRFAADAGFVAERALRSLAHGRATCIPGWGNKLSYAASALTPRFLVRRLMKRILKPG